MSDDARDEQLRAEVSRGQRADVLVNDPLIAEAFGLLEAGYFEGWKTSDWRDTDGRERLWQAAQIIGKVKEHLLSVAQTGKMAAAQVEEIAKHGGKMKFPGVV
jgi:hypothetical protein